MTLSGGSHAKGQTGLTSNGEEKSGTSFPAFCFFFNFCYYFSLRASGKALPVNTVEGDSALLNSLRVVKRPSS